MTMVTRRTRIIADIAPDAVPYDALMEEGRPVVLKGLARHWRLVREGCASAEAAAAYLKSFSAGQPVVGFTGAPEIEGRFFYNDGLTGYAIKELREPGRSRGVP
jgi:hypothetical protein